MSRASKSILKPHRVPRFPSTLIGREGEIVEVCRWLGTSGVRLVTLTGPPGVGKTRLALAAAATVEHEFNVGVLFVNLAPVRDPDLLEHVLVQHLGLRSAMHLSPVERIAAHLGARRFLLVLDNFEQITPAAPRVTTLVAACPNLVVLATSREPLRLSGEREFPVQPLVCPDLSRPFDLHALSTTPAVALFLDRARAIQPTFTVTEENSQAVAEICVRLDGLPLAIELSAARIRAFPPAGILARLHPRLPFLVSGARDLPQRQRTLQAAIAWSEDLLDPHERQLFRRLSIFAGGFTLDAAQIVAAEGAACQETVLSLLEKNLLRRDDAGGEDPRFEMLETIREYAWEHLGSDGELERIRDRHLEHFVRWAEHNTPLFDDAHTETWTQLMTGEYENLRAALMRALERSAMDAAIHLATALCRFWNRRGNVGEAYRWLDAIVRRSDDVSPDMRSDVLHSAAVMARQQGDRVQSAALARESLELGRRAGDPKLIAGALIELAHALDPLQGSTEAGSLYIEALTLAWNSRQRHRVAPGLQGLALVASVEGDLVRAARLLGAAEVRFEAFGISYAPTSVAEQTHMGRTIVTLLTGLGREAFGQAWAEGREMSEKLAVDYALGRAALPDPATKRPTDAATSNSRNPLTRREREVAGLIAQGLSNREIASTLVISERTVDAHVQHILNKLGFHSRAQVAGWVAVTR